MDILYRPYLDPDVVSLIESMHPPRVSVDNDSFSDCTLVKVDSANKHGILLEMVQFLTDLNLVISKSYICSDGGWLMDVFHVTDQRRKKITDENLIRYIQQAFGTGREIPEEVQLCLRPTHVCSEHTALEMTGVDRPGLMSEMSAVLAEMGCHVSAAVVWTHRSRAACILYVAEKPNGAPMTDPCRVARVQAQLENVMGAHHLRGESGRQSRVRVACPPSGKTHIERRLHQLMVADGEYDEEACCCYREGEDKEDEKCEATHVKVDNCVEKGYSIVTVRSRDRPKLLFDTVCTLTDMQYIVFHATINSKGRKAFQEYYIRHKNGCILDLEAERRRLTQCLIAATERRVSHGVRVDVNTENRLGLLSDVTRVLRENGLSISRAEIGSMGERAVGTFYVKDTSGQTVSRETLEMVKKEIGGGGGNITNTNTNTILVVNKSAVDQRPQTTQTAAAGRGSDGRIAVRTRFSLGNMLWSHLERLSSNFKPIKS